VAAAEGQKEALVRIDEPTHACNRARAAQSLSEDGLEPLDDGKAPVQLYTRHTKEVHGLQEISKGR
jgi:hypothetical protein